MARSQAGTTRQRRAAIAIAVTVGLVTLFDISALLYALIQ
jgi:predicted benzoate:H+ symporter BenE